jgi:hypothetical protein
VIQAQLGKHTVGSVNPSRLGRIYRRKASFVQLLDENHEVQRVTFYWRLLQAIRRVLRVTAVPFGSRLASEGT